MAELKKTRGIIGNICINHKRYLVLLWALFISIKAQTQITDHWSDFNKSFQIKNSSTIGESCKMIVIQEGIELRVLLSILLSKGITLTGKEVRFIIEHYDEYKRSFFQNKKHLYKIDSLYTEAYIVHRNVDIRKEAKLKAYEQAPLIKYNDRIGRKYLTSKNHYHYYDYLIDWLQQTEKTEDEIILTFLRGKGFTIDSLLTYKTLSSILSSPIPSLNGFDSTTQKLLTRYRMLAKENEKTQQYAQSLCYVDSIAMLFPHLYADDFERARRLAMKQKMRSPYLQLLKMNRGNPIEIAFYKDTMPTYGRTIEDTAFVKSILKTVDFSELMNKKLPIISYDLLLLSNRYSMLHEFGSNISYPKNAVAYLTENKGRKQNLYLHYVEESFSLYPYAIHFLVRSAHDWNTEINGGYTYINLHLLQYNANGQRVDNSIFELFSKVNAHLVKLGINDLENYYWTEDYYYTAIKHLPSRYGWQMGKGNFDEKIVINKTTIENRRKKSLLPFQFIK